MAFERLLPVNLGHRLEKLQILIKIVKSYNILCIDNPILNIILIVYDVIINSYITFEIKILKVKVETYASHKTVSLYLLMYN